MQSPTLDSLKDSQEASPFIETDKEVKALSKLVTSWKKSKELYDYCRKVLKINLIGIRISGGTKDAAYYEVCIRPNKTNPLAYNWKAIFEKADEIGFQGYFLKDEKIVSFIPKDSNSFGVQIKEDNVGYILNTRRLAANYLKSKLESASRIKRSLETYRLNFMSNIAYGVNVNYGY